MLALKKIAKRVLGPRFTLAARAACDVLRDYPQYLARSGRAARLRSLEFEITFACNARCRMCPIYGEHCDTASREFLTRRREELSAHEIKSVLEQCARMGTQYLQFTGGEPLLRPDLPELIRAAKRFGMTVGMISNGSLLTDQKSRDIVAVGLDWLMISLDGPEEIHDFIRRVPKMFARIESNLSGLRTHRARLGRTTPVLSVGCTVSAYNQFHLHELVPIAAQWQVELILRPIFFSPSQQPVSGHTASSSIKPESWALSESIRNVDVEGLSHELHWVKRLAEQNGVSVSVQMETSVAQIRKRFRDAPYFANNKCFYPWSATRMNPYGDIYNCSLQNLMGNVREQPLDVIWNGSSYTAFRQDLRKCGLYPQCQRCCALNPHDLLGRVLPRFSSLAAPSPQNNPLSTPGIN